MLIGVRLMIEKGIKKSLFECEPFSPRIIRARSNSKLTKKTILLYLAPTKKADCGKKDEVYRMSQDQIIIFPSQDMLIVLRDMKGRVGTHNDIFESCIC